jgi:hypothetical protein
MKKHRLAYTTSDNTVKRGKRLQGAASAFCRALEVRQVVCAPDVLHLSAP